jgi:hypothetical protein
MVVVPTAHDVVLRYGTSRADRAGEVLSVIGVICLLAAALWRRIGGRRRRQRKIEKNRTVAAP